MCTENICGPKRRFIDDLHNGIYPTPPPSKTPRITSLTVFGPFGSILGLVEVDVGARCAELHLVARGASSDVNDG